MRHTTTGNSRPHIVHPGYQHASRHSSRWERPAGEPSLWQGALIVLAVMLLLCTVAVIVP